MEKTTEKNPVEYLEPNPTEEEVEEQIKVIEKVNEAIDEADKNVIQLNYTGTLTHKGYPKDSIVQNIVWYAYKLGGMDFVYVLECENGIYDLKRNGDNGHAWGICQINDRFHKDIPTDYKTNWVVAVEYCYKKRKWGTPFYWPSRIIKWVRCSTYVKDRFILES